MNSRERVVKALNHEAPNKVPVDLGGTPVTGINASTLYRLRKAMNLQIKPIKIQEPCQMLGIVDEEIRKLLGVDVIGLWGPTNALGYKNENWQPWNMPDGTPVLMGGDFEYSMKNGEVYVYPQGDKSVMPSMRMPKDGYFFDSIVRCNEIDESNLDPRADYEDAFSILSDETAKYLETESIRLFDTTNYAIIGIFGEGGFGDAGSLPGTSLKRPKGIRKLDDWLAAHVLYPDYIFEVFEMQAETALNNLQIYKDAVGDRIQAIYISGTDFGTQKGEFISPDMYRKFYKPFNKKINDWVHKNTNWKTFYHSCGSIINILDDLIEAGVDILNPVQCSAEGMEPDYLKKKYGKKLVFWGGGVDTQHTLPFGTVDEVAKQVRERLEVFSVDGGFVFSSIHNIVGNVPEENIVRLFKEIKDFNI